MFLVHSQFEFPLMDRTRCRNSQNYIPSKVQFEGLHVLNLEYESFKICWHPITPSPCISSKLSAGDTGGEQVGSEAAVV
jgi:hypothetical protein